MRLLLQKNALTYVLPDFWLVSSLSLINIHLSWASRFPTEQFTSMKLTMLMSSYLPQQALNALSFLVYFLKTVLSSNRCYIHFNLVRKEFCSIFVLHRKSYHVGIRPVEHSNRSLASLYIPRSSWHPYTVVRMAGSKEAGDRGFAIYFSHKSALDQKTRNHLENIYRVCFQCEAPRLGKGRKQVWKQIWYLLLWSSETTNINEKGTWCNRWQTK